MFLFIAFSMKATHISYMDITYKHLSGNTYEFTLTLYSTCGSSPAPASFSLNYYSPSNSCTSGSVVLLPVAGTGLPIFPICSYPLSVCVGGTAIGFQKHVYKGTGTLPAAYNDWRFVLNYCCRNGAIATILNPLATGIGLTFVINNLDFPGNSSPTFNDEPILFACCNQSFSYNQSATDIDGDSLVYSLYHPYTDAISCTANPTISFTGAYTAIAPITSSPLMSMNASTGYLTMYPSNCIEIGVMGIKVEEYRGGVLIGSILRDNMIIVTNEVATEHQELSKENSFQIYPNPTNSIVILTEIEKESTIEVFNVLGEKVISTQSQNTSVELNLSELENGIYFIQIISDKEIITKQIVKQ